MKNRERKHYMPRLILYEIFTIAASLMAFFVTLQFITARDFMPALTMAAVAPLAVLIYARAYAFPVLSIIGWLTALAAISLVAAFVGQTELFIAFFALTSFAAGYLADAHKIWLGGDLGEIVDRLGAEFIIIFAIFLRMVW